MASLTSPACRLALCRGNCCPGLASGTRSSWVAVLLLMLVETRGRPR